LDNPVTQWPWDEAFTVNSYDYTNYCKPFAWEIVYKNTETLVPFVSLYNDQAQMELHP